MGRKKGAAKRLWPFCCKAFGVYPLGKRLLNVYITDKPLCRSYLRNGGPFPPGGPESVVRFWGKVRFWGNWTILYSATNLTQPFSRHERAGTWAAPTPNPSETTSIKIRISNRHASRQGLTRLPRKG